jgi:recombinational DNA repair protein (RecF pathway)
VRCDGCRRDHDTAAHSLEFGAVLCDSCWHAALEDKRLQREMPVTFSHYRRIAERSGRGTN